LGSGQVFEKPFVCGGYCSPSAEDGVKGIQTENNYHKETSFRFKFLLDSGKTTVKLAD
jgi:hypothetical protein